MWVPQNLGFAIAISTKVMSLYVNASDLCICMGLIFFL